MAKHLGTVAQGSGYIKLTTVCPLEWVWCRLPGNESVGPSELTCSLGQGEGHDLQPKKSSWTHQSSFVWDQGQGGSQSLKENQQSFLDSDKGSGVVGSSDPEVNCFGLGLGSSRIGREERRERRETLETGRAGPLEVRPKRRGFGEKAGGVSRNEGAPGHGPVPGAGSARQCCHPASLTGMADEVP